jgi:ligand-binding SRPBCC domain-containing protein
MQDPYFDTVCFFKKTYHIDKNNHWNGTGKFIVRKSTHFENESIQAYQLKRIQRLPVSLDVAWDFFSSPKNLPKIKPPWLDFSIVSDVPESMRKGDVMTYRIRPLLGVPMTWVSEITRVDKPFLFIDEQRSGPYRFWRHQHQFKFIDSSVEMTDIVYYALKFGFLSNIIQAFVIKRRIEDIFNYRRSVLTEIFSQPS